MKEQVEYNSFVSQRLANNVEKMMHGLLSTSKYDGILNESTLTFEHSKSESPETVPAFAPKKSVPSPRKQR